MLYIGIDPGLSGGIAVLERQWQTFNILGVMPACKVGKKNQLDEREIKSILESNADDALVTIEKVHAMPTRWKQKDGSIRKQGAASMFNFGMGYGLVRGICSGLGIPYQLVTPQAWKKVMLAGYPKGSEYQVASHLWPDVDFRATERCKKPHSGMVDAALIAEYGRRISNSQEGT